MSVIVKSAEQVPMPPSTTGIDFESSGAVVWERAERARAKKIKPSEPVLTLFVVMLVLEYASDGEKSRRAQGASRGSMILRLGAWVSVFGA